MWYDNVLIVLGYTLGFFIFCIALHTVCYVGAQGVMRGFYASRDEYLIKFLNNKDDKSDKTKTKDEDK